MDKILYKLHNEKNINHLLEKFEKNKRFLKKKNPKMLLILIII